MNATEDTLALARALIERPSVTPDDAGCQDLVAARLAGAGFCDESLDRGGVRNRWLRLGDAPPLFVFAGHTDVVPPGPVGEWRYPPFEPTVRDGWLHGRGAADMKGSLAAFVTAAERHVAAGGPARGSLALLLTSDEEGPAVDGTVRVVEALAARAELPTWCLVGEPSSRDRVGDVVRVGRRGSLNARVVVRGVQGHVAYPELARNPIHGFARAVAELDATRFDEGSPDFSPTSFQVSNVHAGTGAENVIPGALEAWINFRYSTAVTHRELAAAVEAAFARHGAEAEIEWRLSGEPFLGRRGALLGAIEAAVAAETGQRPEPSTGGGTSDGRFIARICPEIVELGPVNATIHRVDERVSVGELGALSRIHERVLASLLGPPA